MKGWVGLVGWPVADGLRTLVVIHQLQVERRTGKVTSVSVCLSVCKKVKKNWHYTDITLRTRADKACCCRRQCGQSVGWSGRSCRPSRPPGCPSPSYTPLPSAAGLQSHAQPATQTLKHTHTHTHTRLTALFPGLSGWAGTGKVNQSGFYWSKRQWAICKSAPRSRQITTPVRHHSVFAGRMPFLPPNQQPQSTEGKRSKSKAKQSKISFRWRRRL